MESKTWSFVIPLYPVQFGQVSKSVLKFVHSHVNKFIPELNGLLVDVDKSTLHIQTSEQTNRTKTYPQVYGTFLIRPELNFLRIHAQIKGRVFIPKVGQELEATVLSVKPHMVLCNTEIAQVTVTLSRQGPNVGPNSDDTIPDVKYNQLSQLKPNDHVKVRLTQVILNSALFVIRGELVDIVDNKTRALDNVIKRFDGDSSSESESDEESGLSNHSLPGIQLFESNVQSSLKREPQSVHNSPVHRINIKPEMDSVLWTPEVESLPRKSVKSKRSTESDPNLLFEDSSTSVIQKSSKKSKKSVPDDEIIIKQECL